MYVLLFISTGKGIFRAGSPCPSERTGQCRHMLSEARDAPLFSSFPIFQLSFSPLTPFSVLVSLSLSLCSSSLALSWVRPQCLLERARFHHLQFPVIVLYQASRATPGPWRYLGKRWNVKSQPFLSVSGNPSQAPQPQSGPPMNCDLHNEAQGKTLVRLHRRPL